MTPFTVEPPICSIVYSCETISAPVPELELCSIFDGQTEATFKSISGNYSFQTNDKVEYPPGAYQIKITGSLVDKSDFIILDISLVDLCPTIGLSLNERPFKDDAYVLRDPK